MIGQLILQTVVSIDGYVAALDKSHPWGVEREDEGIKRWIPDSVWAAGAHLMGRVTYEGMAAFWPTSTSERAADERDPQDRLLEDASTRRLAGDTDRSRRPRRGEIRRLKRKARKDLIAYGGASLDQALSRLGLVDEYRLMIQPAALGAGLPLVQGSGAPLHLELVEATTYATGVAIHVYRPRSMPADQPVDLDQPEQLGRAKRLI